MTRLQDKITHALNEARILVLGAQVLLGFQYSSTFLEGFDELRPSSQALLMGALGLMLLAFTLLIWPAAYHRIVLGGDETPGFHRFTSRVIDVALLPIALGTGIDLYVAAEKLRGPPFGLAFGLAGTAVALFFWYGLEAIQRARRSSGEKEERTMAREEGSPPERGRKPGGDDDGTELKDKIEHVLLEAKMVLPGAQALLGFQFATMLVPGFDRLAPFLQHVHLASLGLIALATILLITPAAYHRLVERGEDSEEFYLFASGMVLAAMVPFALGIAGDLYVVVHKVTRSPAFAAVAAGAMLLLAYGLWFGFTLVRRGRRDRRARQGRD